MEQLITQEHAGVCDVDQDSDATTTSTSSGFRKSPQTYEHHQDRVWQSCKKRCFLLNRVNNQMKGQGTKKPDSTTLREP
jgi:hypothetical protein